MKIKTNYTVVDAALKKLWILQFTLLRQKGKNEVMKEHKKIEDIHVIRSVQNELLK